jgi:type 1 fimbria pilin
VRRPCRAAALLAVAFAVLTACAPAGRTGDAADRPPTRDAGAAPAPPDGLTASLVQYRRDQPRRFVEVKFDNATDEALDVTMLDVALPGFGPSGDVRRTTHLEPDRRVDLPVPLGDPRCDTEPDATAAVRVDVRVGDAAPARVTLPIDDDGLLDRLHAFDCAVQRAEEAVDLTLDPVWQARGSGDDLVVAGSATAALRDADAGVEITDVAGGILFIAPPEAVTPAPPVTVDGEATIRFDLIPARCDGHAIAEARRLTTVTFLVAVDGTEAVPVRVAPDDAGFETLVAALRDRCGTG